MKPEVIADPCPAYRELGDRSLFEFVCLRGITPGIETALRSSAFLRYDDVHVALRDHDAFSSVSTPLKRKALPPVVLLYGDPPRHTRFRCIVNKESPAKRIVALTSRITGIANQLLDGLGFGETDVVEHTAEMQTGPVIGAARPGQLQVCPGLRLPPQVILKGRPTASHISGEETGHMHEQDSLRDELLVEVEAIAPTLAEHAAESEKLGRLDISSIEAVRSTRLPGLLAPREFGGLEADPVTVVLVLEAIARIDGSAGWTVGILGSGGVSAAYLPAASARRIFLRGVPTIAGVILPKGQAELVSGGYRVKGRWPFASGIHHADWVGTSAFVPGRPQPEGLLAILLPRDQVIIHDNWQVAGLRGTGSCDFSVEDVLVPKEMTVSLMNFFRGNAVTGGPALRLGLPALFVPFHIGIALGIARRALDEITTQAIEKARGFPPSPLQTHPHLQFALGKAEIELASARAFALHLLSELYAEAEAGRTPPPARQAAARAAATYVTEVAQRVTTVAFQAAGGGALFETNPLQRCYRDIAAAGQHFNVSQTSYRALGQFKLNQPDANPML